jgi:hypothetical protein
VVSRTADVLLNVSMGLKIQALPRDFAAGNKKQRRYKPSGAAESTGQHHRDMAGSHGLEEMLPVPGREKTVLDIPFHRTGMK